MTDEQRKWGVAVVVLGVTLATLAEFPTTEPLAVALVWAVAISVTMVHGEAALAEIRKAV